MKIEITERNEFAEELIDRVVNQDLDVTVVIVGEQGMGKSSLTLWMMMHTASYKYKVIDVAKLIENVAWMPSGFMKLYLQAGEHEPIALEEAGNVASHMTYRSALNRAFAFTQQTARQGHLFKFMNLPFFSELDPDLRRHVNYVIEMNDKTKNQAYGTVYEIKRNNKTGQIYFYTYGTIEFPPLPKKIYRLYLKKKKSIERIRYEARYREVKELEEMMYGRPETRVAKILIENLDDLIIKRGRRKGEIDAIMLAALADVSNNMAYRVAKIYKAEGIEGVKKRFLSS